VDYPLVLGTRTARLVDGDVHVETTSRDAPPEYTVLEREPLLLCKRTGAGLVHDTSLLRVAAQGPAPTGLSENAERRWSFFRAFTPETLSALEAVSCEPDWRERRVRVEAGALVTDVSESHRQGWGRRVFPWPRAGRAAAFVSALRSALRESVHDAALTPLPLLDYSEAPSTLYEE
jgi:hypothetical protein